MIDLSRHSVDAFFQAYKNPKATLAVVEGFSKAFLDGLIVMFSDNGVDFSNLENHFNLKYIHCEENIGVWWSNTTNAFKWLERLMLAINTSKNPYMMILEEDVMIRKRPTDYSENDMIGPYGNAWLSKKATEYLVSKNKKLAGKESLNFGGCGGSIFKKSILQEMGIDNLKRETELAPELNVHLVTDCYLSFLIYSSGGTLGKFPSFVETWQEDIWKNAEYSIVHKYKELYGLELTEEEKRLIFAS